MLRHPSVSDWITLAGLVAAWGISFVMSKLALAHLDPSWIVAMRLCVAGLVMLAILLGTGKRLPRDPQLWLWFAWLGLIGHAAPFYLTTWGLQFTTSGLSGVLMGAIPLFVIITAHFFLPDERLTSMKALGFAIGFAGLIFVLDPRKLSGFGELHSALTGELVILAGCLCYAIHGLFARKIPFQGPLEQTTAVCLCGGAIGLVYALAVAPQGWAGAPPNAYAAVIGLGLIPTALGSLLVYRIMRHAGVSFVAYANYLVPVFALAVGALLLGETVSWTAGVGLTLILAGIAVSRMRKRKITAWSPP